MKESLQDDEIGTPVTIYCTDAKFNWGILQPRVNMYYFKTNVFE